MEASKYVRCVNESNGQVKMLVPAIANNAAWMKSIGFRVEELPKAAEIKPIVKEEVITIKIDTAEIKEILAEAIEKTQTKKAGRPKNKKK